MGFKVASRMRGLSDEAFREAFGTEEQWPLGAGPAALAGRLPLPLLRPSGALRAGGSGSLSMQPVQEADIAHGGHDLRDQAAADTLVRRHPPDREWVELGRRLGVKQPTAWAVKHKIMAVMARREGETALTGRVEMDDAYLGGVRSGGKRGRGAAGKTPFKGWRRSRPVPGAPAQAEAGAGQGLLHARSRAAPSTQAVVDEPGLLERLEEAACSHQARTGSGRQAARMASFKWVNTTLGNIKSAIIASSAPITPDAISPASPGATTGAINSRQ